jgi:protein phosphatase
VITRAVGSDPSVVVDYMKFPLKDIDKLMICSDGLTGCVDDSEINEIINTYTIQEAVIKLIDLANERGGIDNISVIIMKLEE